MQSICFVAAWLLGSLGQCCNQQSNLKFYKDVVLVGVVRREQMHRGKLEDMIQEITCFTNRLLCETTFFFRLLQRLRQTSG